MFAESDDKLIPGEALIYERANGVVYARYRDPPHNTLPRWVVGGDPAGFIPGTSIPKPTDWHIENPLPDWDLISRNETLRNKYKEFLDLQEKYKTWETLSGQR